MEHLQAERAKRRGEASGRKEGRQEVSWGHVARSRVAGERAREFAHLSPGGADASFVWPPLTCAKVSATRAKATPRANHQSRRPRKASSSEKPNAFVCNATRRAPEGTAGRKWDWPPILGARGASELVRVKRETC